MSDPKIAPLSPPIGIAVLGTGSSLVAFHRPSVLALKGKYELRVVMERRMQGRGKEICGAGVKVVATLAEVCADQTVDIVSLRGNSPLSLRRVTPKPTDRTWLDD